MDRQMLLDQISGTEAAIVNERNNLDLFNKVSGIVETVERSRTEVADMDEKIIEQKKLVKDLEKQRDDIMRPVIIGFAEKMKDLVCDGVGVFGVDPDGTVRIGLEKKGVFRPFDALSGGELVDFSAALSTVLMEATNSSHKVLIIEAGEADGVRLHDIIGKLNQLPDIQTIVSTCHPPSDLALESIHNNNNWKVVFLPTTEVPHD